MSFDSRTGALAPIGSDLIENWSMNNDEWKAQMNNK